MKDYVNTFIEENHLSIAGKSFYGVIHGYQVSTVMQVQMGAAMYYFQTMIFTSRLDDAKNEQLLAYLKENKKELKLINYGFVQGGFVFQPRFTTQKSAFENYQNALNAILNKMASIGFLDSTHCPYTGETMTSPTLVCVNDYFYANIDESSKNKLDEMAQKAEEEYQASPNNYLKGTLGAVVGGLIGAVAWIVIGLFGFISGWIAALMSYLAGVGYDKMHGKKNAMKVVITSIVTLVLIVVSMFILYTVLVSMAMANEGIEGSAVNTLFILLKEDPEIKAGFVKDLILALVFGAIGVVISAVNMKKTLHKKQK